MLPEQPKRVRLLAGMLILGYMRIVSSVAGAFLFLLALRNAWRGYSSRRWPRTTGRVTRSFVLVGHDGDGGATYTPRIEYEYAIGGTSYHGTLLKHGAIGCSSRERAEKVLVPYPVGSEIVVLFDPRQPSTSVLLPGMALGNLAIAAGGLAFLLCAALLWQTKR